MKRLKFIIFFFICVNGLSTPITDEVRFNPLTIDDGLSQNTVYCILRDRTGFMWFGTEKGLNRFDGHNFKVYRSRDDDPETISYDMILSISESPGEPGILWIGTWGGGLNRFDTITETFTRHRNDPHDPRSICDDNVRALFHDPQGKLWIGTDKGVSCAENGESVFENFPLVRKPGLPDSAFKVLSLALNPYGEIIAGTDGAGIYRLEKERRRFVPWPFREFPQALNSGKIRSLILLKTGILWAGTSGSGIFSIENNSGKVIVTNQSEKLNIKTKFIRALHRDHFGMIWTGTHGEGVVRIDPKTGKWKQFLHSEQNPAGLSNNIILSIFEDREHILWIGTFGGGVNKFNNHDLDIDHIQIREASGGLEHNVVTSLHTGIDGKIWFGTEGGGVGYITGKSRRIKAFRIDPSGSMELSKKIIYSIYESDDGKLWLGTWGAGLLLFGNDNGFVRQFNMSIDRPPALSNNRIVALAGSRTGEILIGTWGGGLNILDISGNSIDIYSADHKDQRTISHNKVLAIRESGDGTIWIGTERGLNRFNRKTKIFHRFLHHPESPGSLNNNKVISLFIDKSGVLWVGTDRGLNQYIQENGSFISYGKKNGLHGESVHGILGDSEGNLWVSTNFGLNKFNPESKQFIYFDIRGKAKKYEFSRAHTKGYDGVLYYGGVDGISAVQPDKLFQSMFRPGIVFTSFRILGKEIAMRKSFSTTDQLSLSHRDSIISVEFSSLSFADPGKIHYAYQISGLTKEWIHIGNNNSISFTRMPPGRYTLRIKGTNSDGVWNENRAELSIRVKPPFWMTWWFISLVTVVIVQLFFLWHRGRMNRLKRRLRTENAVDRLCMNKGISTREKEVMMLVVSGLSNKEIEDTLFISPHTVKNHIYNIFQKLQVSSRAQLTEIFRNYYFLSEEEHETEGRKT